MPERRVLDLERLAGIHQNAGVNHGDVRVPLEVGGVEREQVSHAVNLHGSGQPGVMNLNAQDGMGDHETTPFVVDRLANPQEHHSLFDRADFAVRVPRRQSEAVPVRGPRCHVPKLGNVLMCVVQNGARFGQPCKSGIHDGMVRVIAPRDSEQDIGIDPMRRGRH